MSHPTDTTSAAPAHQRKFNLLQTLRAVAWSFLGIRRASDYESDVQRLNPVHVVVAGVVAAAAFVGLLFVAVRWIVSSGVAT